MMVADSRTIYSVLMASVANPGGGSQPDASHSDLRVLAGYSTLMAANCAAQSHCMSQTTEWDTSSGEVVLVENFGEGGMVDVRQKVVNGNGEILRVTRFWVEVFTLTGCDGATPSRMFAVLKGQMSCEQDAEECGTVNESVVGILVTI